MADYWTTDWLTRSEMFASLRAAGSRLPHIGWPDTELLTTLADDAPRVVNAQGLRVRFVPQSPSTKKSEHGFEQRAFLKGEVQVRPLDWHDLFNALVWVTFPTSKAVINARHYEGLAKSGLFEQASAASSSGATSGVDAFPRSSNRSAVRDALTLFDEDGILVLSKDVAMLDLVREFRWKELFWDHRNDVLSRMRFFIFGHALYHKALNPFIGMTGKAVLLGMPEGFMELALPAQISAADRLLSSHIWDRNNMQHGRELAPLPVLGVPGWWPDNEQESFFDNSAYFRPGRHGASVAD